MVCADRIDVSVLAPSASTDGDRIALGLEEGLYVVEVTRDGEWQGQLGAYLCSADKHMFSSRNVQGLRLIHWMRTWSPCHRTL